MRVALVNDYLNQYGGAERVLEVLCEIFPDAPIFTLVYDEQATRGVFSGRNIRTSFLQKIPFSRAYHRWFPLLMPIAIEQFDFSHYDLVLSVAASFSKGIITKTRTRHINYCLTPPRFLWDNSHNYISEIRYPNLVQKILPPFIAYLRMWDQQAAQRPDDIVAISQCVQERIQKYYRRESGLIYPPIDAAKFAIADAHDDYFLMVGRLVEYKRFDLVIQVFNAIEKPLKIVGDGPEKERLQKMAAKNIEFVGSVSDEELARLYSRAEALIFPQEEDFGLVALESMASGRPVIAYRAGGALETVIDGVTGIFFDGQTEIDLAQAIGRYYQTNFEPATIRQHALRFDKEVFKRNILNLLTK